MVVFFPNSWLYPYCKIPIMSCALAVLIHHPPRLSHFSPPASRLPSLFPPKSNGCQDMCPPQRYMFLCTSTLLMVSKARLLHRGFSSRRFRFPSDPGLCAAAAASRGLWCSPRTISALVPIIILRDGEAFLVLEAKDTMLTESTSLPIKVPFFACPRFPLFFLGGGFRR